jgi:hypothetical protein
MMLFRLFLSTTLAVTSSTAFQVHSSTTRTVRASAPYSQSQPQHPRGFYATPISIEETANRDIDGLASWASEHGVLQENGFELSETATTTNNNKGDWSVKTSQAAIKSSRVLYVPNNLLLSSKRIREEMGADHAQPVMEFLVSKGAMHMIPQFFLWHKVLEEYEKGDESFWHAWMQSLPRRFSTAVSLDDFEMAMLPPFVESLAKIDRIYLSVFREALLLLNDNDKGVPSAETKSNDDLTQWAFNVVFTRGWGNAIGECDIVPMADMFNHGAEADVEVQYDKDGNCNVVLIHGDVPAGAPLRLSYGLPTNPSRLLATFGFLDESPPATFCKIMALRPSQELLDIGYDFSRMVFYVEDGAIAEEVWDVVLYSLLEDLPDVRQAFYDAHRKGDRDTKVAIHGQFFLQTCNALLAHVDGTLMELEELSQQIEKEGTSKHARLPMIRDHNEFVRETFLKVKARLDQMVQAETERRKSMEQQQEE